MTDPSTSSSVIGVPDGELSVVVDDLHVEYRVYEEEQLTVQQLVRRGLRSRRSTTVHAVRGVSFEVRMGEAVGIVGSNGSGKSTLLRAIAGLQPKTGGRVLVRDQPRLLGVGAALKPQLSGYRNVLLGGLAMGISRDDIEAKMPEIIDYSGLGDAMGRPLKTYSSGMRARLAFSIATLRTPEILLIDEALAVGDRLFRYKSITKIREIRDNAKTVIMVTHNLGEIRQTCNRAMWLDNGVILADGSVDDVLEAYETELGDDA